MKRYNFRVNSNNVIVQVSNGYLDENLPILEIEDNQEIFPGYSKIVDNKFIENKPEGLRKRQSVNGITAIQAWFQATDWKVNKIITGEWTKDDPRWIDYLAERKIKREEQDKLLAELKYEDKNRK